jgi:hypothetical protein
MKFCSLNIYMIIVPGSTNTYVILEHASDKGVLPVQQAMSIVDTMIVPTE